MRCSVQEACHALSPTGTQAYPRIQDYVREQRQARDHDPQFVASLSHEQSKALTHFSLSCTLPVHTYLFCRAHFSSTHSLFHLSVQASRICWLRTLPSDFFEKRDFCLICCAQVEVHVVSNIHTPDVGPMPCEARAGALFVGSFEHPPNREAVHHLISDILPEVLARLPAALAASFKVGVERGGLAELSQCVPYLCCVACLRTGMTQVLRCCCYGTTLWCDSLHC